MSKAALLALFVCLFFAGCYLPRTTPLAGANCKSGEATARFNVVGRKTSVDEISGVGGSLLYGLTDSTGVNLNLLFEEARHREPGIADRYSEFSATLDLVLELAGGDKVSGETVRDFSMAYYLGAGPVRQSWRGKFFEDEDVKYHGTDFCLHTGLQAEVPLSRRAWTEFYFDFHWRESVWTYAIPFWTIGTNLCFKPSAWGAEMPSFFAGVSVTNVQETVLTENWILAAGIIWDFGGPVAVPAK